MLIVQTVGSAQAKKPVTPTAVRRRAEGRVVSAGVEVVVDAGWWFKVDVMTLTMAVALSHGHRRRVPTLSQRCPELLLLSGVNDV
jgi:hypothetical protein